LDSTKDFLSGVACEVIYLANELKAFLPETAEKILNVFKDGKVASDVQPLFPRLD
jgi:hypothetical protein